MHSLGLTLCSHIAQLVPIGYPVDRTGSNASVTNILQVVLIEAYVGGLVAQW